MLSKRSIQEVSVAFFLNDMIDEAELQSILEITNTKNRSFPYWKYNRIEGTLDNMSESETKAEFNLGLVPRSFRFCLRLLGYPRCSLVAIELQLLD